MRNCYICKGDVEKKLVTVEREWNGKKIIIKDVPAEVCEQCGERYFNAETTLRMEKIKKVSVFPEEQTITVPVSVRKFDCLQSAQEG